MTLKAIMRYYGQMVRDRA